MQNYIFPTNGFAQAKKQKKINELLKMMCRETGHQTNDSRDFEKFWSEMISFNFIKIDRKLVFHNGT